MTVKFYNIKSIDKFMKVIDSCKGKIEIVTENGDKLNLKSKLSQYIAIVKLFGINAIKEIEVITHERSDFDILLKAMVNGI